MRFRTLLMIGGVVGLIGTAIGTLVHSSSGVESPNEAVFIVAGLSIVVVLAGVGFVAGWFGRERDDVVIVAVGAGIAGAAVGAATWWIGDLICDARDLPTAHRLVAPAYAEDHPVYPLWTTDAGPAIRTTLDQLAQRVAPRETVDGRAVGIVLGLPRDVPVVVVLVGGRLVLQPVTINGAANGEPRALAGADIAAVSMRSVKPDGTERQINAYDDVITITSADGSNTRFRLPYGTRGVGTATGGPDVIRRWLTA